MKKNILLILAILLAGCANKTTSLGECTFEVEEARSYTELTEGLSGRKTLSEDNGMLFFMPYEIKKGDATGFHMRGMQFDLDLLFFDKHGVLTEIQTVPRCESEDCPYYQPEKAARFVLEIQNGRAEACQIELGEKINSLQ